MGGAEAACVSPAAGLDSDLSTLLVWLAKNRSIRHLSLGKNFNNIKSKWVQEAAVKQNLDLTSLLSHHLLSSFSSVGTWLRSWTAWST